MFKNAFALNVKEKLDDAGKCPDKSEVDNAMYGPISKVTNEEMHVISDEGADAAFGDDSTGC